MLRVIELTMMIMGRQAFLDTLGRVVSHRGCISFSIAHFFRIGSLRIYYRLLTF
jgi:hypothetical protein